MNDHLASINFWTAFRESGAAQKCFGQIKALADRDGKKPSEVHVDSIFRDCLQNSRTIEILREKALDQLNATNWVDLDPAAAGKG